MAPFKLTLAGGTFADVKFKRPALAFLLSLSLSQRNTSRDASMSNRLRSTRQQTTQEQEAVGVA